MPVLFPELQQVVDTPELDVVRVVCLNDAGQVLLVKESDDENWKLPGGKIHEDETILVAIEREIKEELGFAVSESAIVAYTKATIPHSPNFRHIVRLELDPASIQPTEEVVEYDFFDVANLPDTKFAEHISTAVALVAS